MNEANVSDHQSAMTIIETIFHGDFLSGSSDRLFSGNVIEWLISAGTTFALIATAEIGDKSQVVCMTLAARYHRGGPVLLGAIIAFALLNFLAIVFGVIVATWIPDIYLMALVAMLFTIFGIHALRIKLDVTDDKIALKSTGNIFFATFLLITLAEFGDKTQLAVAALGSTMDPVSVWIGATAALAMTSAIGIWAGISVLRKIPIERFHRISGAVFLILAAAACYQILIKLDFRDWQLIQNPW